MRTILAIAIFFCASANVRAAEEAAASQVYNAAFEFGPQMGNILPNQIDGVTEIHPQWGVWTGFGLGGDTTMEFLINAGNGNNVEWSQGSASLRMDFPVETLVGFAYIGADATHFKGSGKAKKLFGGGHVGGGFLTVISRDLWFRVDMKFNVNPGTSLYISSGFIFRFGSEEKKN